MTLRITRERAIPPAGHRLIEMLTADLNDRYADEDGTGHFAASDVEQDRGAFVIAWEGNEALACGALRPLAPGVAEVKRMYTHPAARRRGLARRILAELESAARDYQYRTVRLHTGEPQPEAIRLYENAGYHRIPNYGVYAHDGRSVSFEKDLAPSHS